MAKVRLDEVQRELLTKTKADAEELLEQLQEALEAELATEAQVDEQRRNVRRLDDLLRIF
jgi:cell division protein FtsX|tara:strand:+ start:362 stop:541 length:180 start_codon:yes stop_codon:yes gene_type:complete